ncbi:hypothetical protein [Halobacillus seohaensis]|uniref:Uncharacterized protein n=1 Tax=Halobacillus seohaensis TaxID=447421 RepID=A0ABW2ERF6_9BACI
MKQMNEKNQSKSLQLLRAIHFAKKSMKAYQHAKDVIEDGSPIAEEITEECVRICRNCVNELAELKDSEIQEMTKFCMANTILCEELHASLK